MIVLTVEDAYQDLLRRGVFGKERAREALVIKPRVSKTLVKPAKYSIAPSVGGVYFLLSDCPTKPTPCKIGFALRDISKRVSTLKTAHPWPLRCVAHIPGAGHEEEVKLHRQFADLRMREAAGSEWFRLEGELARFVRDLVVAAQDAGKKAA